MILILPSSFSSFHLSVLGRLLILVLLLWLSLKLLALSVFVRSKEPVSLYPKHKQLLRQVQDQEVGLGAAEGGVPDSRRDPHTQTLRRHITTIDIKLPRPHESTDAGDQGKTSSVTKDVPRRKGTNHTVGGKKNTTKGARQIPEDAGKTSGDREQQVSPGQQNTHTRYYLFSVCECVNRRCIFCHNFKQSSLTQTSAIHVQRNESVCKVVLCMLI